MSQSQLGGLVSEGGDSSIGVWLPGGLAIRTCKGTRILSREPMVLLHERLGLLLRVELLPKESLMSVGGSSSSSLESLSYLLIRKGMTASSLCSSIWTWDLNIVMVGALSEGV